MPHQSPERKGSLTIAMEPVKPAGGARLGTVSGVYIPVYLNILSILMFLRFGQILGQVGFIGILGKSQTRTEIICNVQFQPVSPY